MLLLLLVMMMMMINTMTQKTANPNRIGLFIDVKKMFVTFFLSRFFMFKGFKKFSQRFRKIKRLHK